MTTYIENFSVGIRDDLLAISALKFNFVGISSVHGRLIFVFDSAIRVFILILVLFSFGRVSE